MSGPFRFTSIALWFCLFLPALTGAGESTDQPASPWHHPLSMGQGDCWTSRIAMEIVNPTPNALEGRPLPVPVGKGPGKVDIAGARTGHLRLVDASGVELLFAVLDAGGTPLTEGVVPEDSILVIPGDCPARAAATVHLYFDNPRAWETPDFLPNARFSEFNGAFEKGRQDQPAGWPGKETDADHRVIWDRKGGRSGTSAIRVEVDARAAPSWVGVSHFVEGVNPGTKYRLQGWVKAEGVKGSSGWFVHAGSPERSQILNRTLAAGEGDFDWREVTTEFSVPDGATYLTVGTILHGTGNAWFDDCSLVQIEGEAFSVRCGAVESLKLQRRGQGAARPASTGFERALDLRIANVSPTPRNSVLVQAQLGNARHLPSGSEPAQVRFEDRVLPSFLLGGTLLFEHDIPPQSVDTCQFFYSTTGRAASAGKGELPADAILPSDYTTGPAKATADQTAYARLLSSPANLVRNACFEDEGEPVAWLAAKDSNDLAKYGVASNGPFGSRSAQLHVPPEAKQMWRGWKQRVPVQAGRTYLYAVWAKCQDVKEGKASLHAHLLNGSGKLVEQRAFLSAGTPLEGTADWTLWQGTAHIPADGAQLELHLTMEAKGTLWHDGAFVGEVVHAFVEPSGASPAADARLCAWPVNPVIKVFREDNSPVHLPEKACISLAQNEAEPLQIAIRGVTPMEAVHLEADSPVGPGEARLPAPEIHRVGYVPIDYPTSYYQSTSPAWHRKSPTQAAQCDGWAGWWPDPLLPNQPLAVPTGATQPFWLTFQAPAGTAPGRYRTAIRLQQGERTLAELPVEITVRPFALPAESSFAAIYDLRLGRQWMEPGKPGTPIRRNVMEFMKSRRLCPDRPEANPVFRREGDQIVADFTAYDEETSVYFDTLRFPRAYTPQFFYLFGWGHPPKAVLGESPYPGEPPYEGADRSQLRAEYKRVYQECLRLYWEHVKAKGWADRLVLYISDEPHFTHEHIRRQMVALCEMIHEVNPAIPIYSSTWRHCPDWNDSLDVWGVGHYGCFDVAEMERRKAAGKRIWFTTDGQMCTDTPFCAVERLLPHYAFKYGAEAYEFWGVGWLTYDPYRFGWHSYIHQSSEPGREFYVRYPNGDGYLLYPGKPLGIGGAVSSIRFEQAREGVEDYEYLQLLSRLLRDAPAHHPARSGAEKALREAAKLVEIPNAGGRFSSQILPDPDAVLRVRDQIAESIVALGGSK